MTASPRSIRAGAAYVELYGDDSRLQRTLKRAQRELKAFGAGARALGAATFAAVSATVIPIAAVSIKAASDAQEIRNRFAQVFRDQAKAAGLFADQLGESVGRSGTRLRAALADFQGFFVGLGFGSAEARELSQRMTALALDFASFNNLSDDEAIGRFISALSGSSEVLDRFGINIKASALDLELQRSGLGESTASADELSKALARVAIISRSMGDQGATGDAARTAGGFANQSRRLVDEVFELRAAVGDALLPQVERGTRALNGVVRAARDWAEQNGAVIRTTVAVSAVVATAAAGLFLVGVAATALSSPLIATAAGVVAIAAALELMTGVGRSAVSTFVEVFPGMLEVVNDVWSGILDRIESGDLASAVRYAAQGAGFALATGLAEAMKLAASIFGQEDKLPVLDIAIDAIRAQVDALAAVRETAQADAETAVAAQAAANRTAATAGLSTVGSLSGFSATQRLFGAGSDKLAASVGRIEGLVRRIESNTQNGLSFG